MVYLFYTIYISVYLAHHMILRTKVGNSGIISYIVQAYLEHINKQGENTTDD